jgi:hypothetical protein
MNATATKGIWTKELPGGITILFDTTLNPERITIQKIGCNPHHFPYPDGIGEDEINMAINHATELFEP